MGLIPLHLHVLAVEMVLQEEWEDSSAAAASDLGDDDDGHRAHDNSMPLHEAC